LIWRLPNQNDLVNIELIWNSLKSELFGKPINPNSIYVCSQCFR